MINFVRDTNAKFIDVWKTKSGIFAFSLASVITYMALYIFSDSERNPLLLVWWAFIGSYGYCFFKTVEKIYQLKKRDEFDEKIKTPSGYVWTIYTTDDAKIGEVSDTVLYEAQYLADICLRTKMMQFLNYCWVSVRLVSNLLNALPLFVIIVVGITAFVEPKESLEAITLGQIMIEIKSFVPLFGLFITLYLTSLVLFKVGAGKPLDGYKDYYGIRLKSILSKDIPNIANADGFRIEGISFSSNGHIDLKELKDA